MESHVSGDVIKAGDNSNYGDENEFEKNRSQASLNDVIPCWICQQCPTNSGQICYYFV